MKRHITIPKNEIEAFCRENHIRSLAVFGSALREDFGPESDIDILVEFEHGQEPDLFKIMQQQEQLSAIFSRSVDLIERRSVEKSPNYIRKKHILESLETIYVER